MIIVSSITKNTGRYAINFAFNLPHYVTSYMHHKGKKESKKEIFYVASREFEPGPSESVRTKR